MAFKENEPTLIENWHEISNLEHEVTAIREPFHGEDVFCYLIKGRGRDLLIDTGMGIVPLKPVLEKLRNSSNDLIVVNSHWHFDHIGGNTEFKTVFTPANKAELTGYQRGWSQADLQKYSFTKEFDQTKIPKGFDPDKFVIEPANNILPILNKNIEINLGNRKIQVIETPGHTPGSLSFFDRTNGLLFTTDLLYEGPLYAFEDESDPEKYLNSLKEIAKLPVKLIHPGHNHSSNKDYPNLVQEAIELFERARSKEKPDAVGEFPNTVEYKINEKRRLRIIVKE